MPFTRPNAPNRGSFDDVIHKVLSEQAADAEGTMFMYERAYGPKKIKPALTPEEVADIESEEAKKRHRQARDRTDRLPKAKRKMKEIDITNIPSSAGFGTGTKMKRTP